MLRLFRQRSSHLMTLESQNKWLGEGLFTSIYAFGANPKWFFKSKLSKNNSFVNYKSFSKWLSPNWEECFKQ